MENSQYHAELLSTPLRAPQLMDAGTGTTSPFTLTQANKENHKYTPSTISHNPETPHRENVGPSPLAYGVRAQTSGRRTRPLGLHMERTLVRRKLRFSAVGRAPGDDNNKGEEGREDRWGQGLIGHMR